MDFSKGNQGLTQKIVSSPSKESCLSNNSLPETESVTQRQGSTKKRKENAVSVKVMWPLDCLYALNREWTWYKRWVTKMVFDT